MKFFTVFLFWSSLGSGINFGLLLRNVIYFKFKNLIDAKKLLYSRTYVEVAIHLKWLFIIVIGMALCLALCIALFILMTYNLNLISKGMTYVDTLKNKKGERSCAEFRRIMGRYAVLWFVPMVDYEEEKEIEYSLRKLEETINKDK